MNDAERKWARELYERHLYDGQSIETTAAFGRVIADDCTIEDLIKFIDWELRECVYSLPPEAPDTRPIDGDHASACAMRAMSAVRQLERKHAARGRA